MKYSCFNQDRGLYQVFEDRATVPVNGDLPLPQLGSEVNTIGVPSLEAARPLPAGAVPRGESWSPVGLVVDCRRQGLGSLTIGSWSPEWKSVVVGALVGFLVARIL